MITCDQIPTFMQIDLFLADSWQKARPILRYFTSLSYLVSLLRVFLLKICQKSIKWHKNWCINIFHYYATFLLNKIFRLFTAKKANLSITQNFVLEIFSKLLFPISNMVCYHTIVVSSLVKFKSPTASSNTLCKC